MSSFLSLPFSLLSILSFLLFFLPPTFFCSPFLLALLSCLSPFSPSLRVLLHRGPVRCGSTPSTSTLVCLCLMSLCLSYMPSATHRWTCMRTCSQNFGQTSHRMLDLSQYAVGSPREKHPQDQVRRSSGVCLFVLFVGILAQEGFFLGHVLPWHGVLSFCSVCMGRCSGSALVGVYARCAPSGEREDGPALYIGGSRLPCVLQSSGSILDVSPRTSTHHGALGGAAIRGMEAPGGGSLPTSGRHAGV